MKMTVIGTGSRGNCYIIENEKGNTLILEAGIKPNLVVPHIDFRKTQGCLISHLH